MTDLAATSVPYEPAVIGDTPNLTLYDLATYQALDRPPYDVRAAWMARYAAQEDAAFRAEPLVERAGTALIAAGRLATIHDVWMLLARRAGGGGDADMRAAAALAGMAMGLRAS